MKKKYTITKYIDKKHLKIFKELCFNSKSVFNCCVYSYNIFSLYKNNIYSDMFEYYKKNNNKVDQKQIFQLYFKKYYDIYTNNKQLVKTNNSFIYNFIKNNKKYVNINTTNYNKIKSTLLTKLKNKVEYNDNNKYIVFEHIIEKILISFYYKRFFIIKRQIQNHQKLDELDIKYKDILDDVKNNKSLHNEDNNYDQIKTKINVLLKEYNQKELYSQQYLFKMAVYDNHLGNIEKNILPADITLNIIDKYFESIDSYYASIKKGIKANKPKFKNKDDLNNLYYFPSSFKIINNCIRLNVGDYIGKNLSNYKNINKYKNKKYYYSKNIINKKEKGLIKVEEGYVNKKSLVDGQYIYIKLPKEGRLKCCIIKPFGDIMKILFIYEKIVRKPVYEKPTVENSISIDLGLKNLMTIYNPTGTQKIIKGGKLVSLNEFYIKKIGSCKKEDLYSLHEKRKNVIYGYINKLVSKIKELYANKKNIIIGYNEGWKNKINLGKDNNRKFCKIPFNKIINELKNRLSILNINIIKTEESYTSKCDALNLEKIGPKKKYDGIRTKRGLFISKTGKAINGDLNGAINIMRKVINLREIKGEKIYNPLKIDL